MPSQRLSSPRVASLLRRGPGRVLLALALVGLVLLMHALTVAVDGGGATTAGGHDDPARVMSRMSETSGTAPTGLETLVALGALADHVVVGDSQHPGPGHLGAHGGMALMCLAVLALTALLVLRPGSGRGWWPSLPDDARRGSVATLVRSRGPAPPDLHQLSILRC